MLQKNRYYSEKEVSRLFVRLAELEAEERKHFKSRWCVSHMALSMTFSCGLRVGELRIVRHNDIDIVSELPSLYIRNGKGGKQRFVPINSHLATHIKRFCVWKESVGLGTGDEDYFLESPRGKCYSIGGLESMFKAAIAEAKLPERSIHALRHSFAFQVYRKTRDIRGTQQLLGHQNILSTQCYTFCQFDTLSNYVEEMAQEKA